MDIPIIIKILVSLGLILGVNKAAKNLSFSLLVGTVVIALWSGQPLSALPVITWHRFWSLDNAMLSAIIVLVIWLSSQMAKANMMSDLVKTINGKISYKGALIVLPAVIGLLPMPGGALFSAPLVDDCDEENEITPLLKTRINYWFRHIWEYTWPLYPGLIITSDISGLPIWKLSLLGIPMTIAALASGYFFFIRGLKISKKNNPEGEHHFLKLISPILIVIVSYVLILVLLPSVSRISKYLPMTIGLIMALGFLQILRPLPAREWKSIILSKKALNMVIIVILVRIYGAFIEAKLPGGMYLMEQMRLELNSLGIPIVLLVIIIPFISGLTTGVSVGFVGASLPIIVSLLGPNPQLSHLVSTVVLSFAFGFMGVMLSPVHVCLIVTNEYFKTSLARSLSAIALPVAAVMGFALIYSWILW